MRFEYSQIFFETSTMAPLLAQSATVEGVVIRAPDVREKTKHLIVKIEDTLVLLIVDRYATGDYGDILEITGILEEPQAFTSDLGRTFNYPGYLRAQGVSYVMTFPSVVVEKTGQGNALLANLYRAKQMFSEQIDTFIPEPAAGLGLGVLLGIKQALGESLETIFRQTGIIHIVVLSGYNIMLVVAAVMYLLTKVFPVRTRAVVGIVAIVLFALLVGLSATVVRASVMASLVLIAQIFGRQYDMMRALLIAGIIMVLYQPYILAFDIGFQLSFMATLGLIFVAPYFESLLVQAPTRLGLKEFFIATLATQIAVAPLLLFHIGEISLIVVLVNMLVLPLVPLAMLATAVTGIIAILAPVIAPIPALVAYSVLTTIIVVATWCAAIPFASLSVPVFPWYGIPLTYSLIGLLLYLWKKRLAKVASTSVIPSSDFEIDISAWTVVVEGNNILGKAVQQETINAKRSEQIPLPQPEVPIFFR